MSDIPGYTILRPLGQGGMATVYLALQQSLGREVALKILSPALAQDATATQRFLREARLAANLHHPNIVPIHDVGIHNGTPYMAMEYVPGGNVAPAAGGAGDPNAVLRCVRDIAGALDHAHRQGVIHRDIKPENILRQINGSCVLSDFGIALTIESTTALTQEGDTVGTPHYMSPEHLRGEKVDGRSDLYSLGVLLYQLLTGKRPYSGTDSWAIGTQHISAPIPRMPKTLERLQPLVDGLMGKQPAVRPQTGAEVVRQIDVLLAGGTATPTMALPAAAPAPRRRTPWLIGATIALVAVGGMALSRYGRPHADAKVVAVPIAAAPAATVPATSTIPDKSIAVLPFVNMSGDKDNEYFSDGMSEEILNALAKVKDLKVAGRTSSFYYKGRNEDLRSIGKALGVANVLEGSVRKQGDKVRITAQLIRTNDDFHLWSETYDGDLKDVFALQERIARAITNALSVVLSGNQAEHLVNAGTKNPEAYALFLQATGTFNRRDDKHFLDAIAQLTEAIRLDPNFARAHSRLAAVQAVAAYYVPTISLAASQEAAELQLQAAIKLDPGLAEPYAVLGNLRGQQRRLVESELAYRHALELDPDDVTNNLWHGLSLAGNGYTKQGIAALDNVLRVEPLLPLGLSWRGTLYAYAGDLANAERLLRRAEDVGLLNVGWGRSVVAEARGQKAEAIKQLTSFLRFLMPGFPLDNPEILAQGIDGAPPARAKALALIDRYLASKPVTVNKGIVFALIRLGEPARALTLVPDQLTTDSKDGFYLNLLWSRNGREARATPEFQAFIHRFGLVDLWDKYGPPDLCDKNTAGDYVCQ